MQVISFNDANDIVVSVELDGNKYYLRITWNQVGDFWTMHLWDSHREPLLCNIKLVPNYPLLINHHRPGVPTGNFLLLTNGSKPISRDSFSTGAAALVYVSEDE
mgnify:CR=1 FL=1